MFCGVQRMQKLTITLIVVLGTVSLGWGKAAEGWKNLFDGSTLEGWVQKNGTAKNLCGVSRSCHGYRR